MEEIDEVFLDPETGEPVEIIETHWFEIVPNDSRTTPTGSISLNDVRGELGFGGGVNMNDWRVRHLGGVNHSSGGRYSMSDLRGRNARFSISFGKNYAGGYKQNMYLYCRGAPPYCPINAHAEISEEYRAYLEGHGNKSVNCNVYGNADIWLGRCVYEYWETNEDSQGNHDKNYGQGKVRAVCNALNIGRGTGWVWIR